jgi:DNA polymerase-3 subunit gamma/tau
MSRSSAERLNLARKYRPTKLSELRGQSQAVQLLSEALKSDRIAPAYLFSGPRGVGKTSAARIFAKAASCTQIGSAPCEKCDSCLSIETGSAMNLLEIDGASHTGVDDVRRLIDAASYRPAVGRKNVYIVDEVHMLSQAAFNALLKTLEEPPPHVLFLFATTELQKIPDTILSRVQRIELRRVSESEIISCLKDIMKAEKLSASDEVLSQVAAAADGAFRDSQTLLEQVLLLSGGKEAKAEVADQLLGTIGSSQEIKFLELLAQSDGESFLRLSQDFYQRGKDLEKILQRLIFWLRCLILFRAAPRLESLKTEAPQESLDRLSKAFISWSEVDLDRLFDVLWSGYERIKKSDLPLVTLETTLLRASRLPKTKDLARLIQELENTKSSSNESERSPAPISRPASAPAKFAEPSPPPVHLGEAKIKAEGPVPRAKHETPQTKDQLFQGVKRLKPSLFPLMSSASKSEWMNDQLILSYPAGHFALEQLSEPALKKDLLVILSQLTGREQKLEIRSTAEAGSSNSAPKERLDFMKEAKQKAAQDPKVLKAAELLGGKVTGITIEGVKSS